jgi:hypothetical protein
VPSVVDPDALPISMLDQVDPTVDEEGSSPELNPLFPDVELLPDPLHAITASRGMNSNNDKIFFFITLSHNKINILTLFLFLLYSYTDARLMQQPSVLPLPEGIPAVRTEKESCRLNGRILKNQ